MRKFVLKVQVGDDVDLSGLEGETLSWMVIDGDKAGRLGVEGAWELIGDRARTFVFVGEEVTQQVAKVHVVPEGRGFAIASSQEGQRTPGLKAAPVSQEDSDRLRKVVREESSDDQDHRTV